MDIQPTFDITVPSAAWEKLQQLKGQISALENEAKTLQKELGIPGADSLVALLALKEGEKCSIPVKNGNGMPVGKLSVFHFGGATIPPAWRTRLS